MEGMEMACVVPEVRLLVDLLQAASQLPRAGRFVPHFSVPAAFPQRGGGFAWPPADARTTSRTTKGTKVSLYCTVQHTTDDERAR